MPHRAHNTKAVFFAFALAFVALPAFGIVGPAATLSPANPTSDDEVELHTYLVACWHIAAARRAPAQIRIRYSPGAIAIDVQQQAYVCFSAGAPPTVTPYVIPLGRLGAGSYSIEVTQGAGAEPAQTLVVSQGARPPPGPEAEAMSASSTQVMSGETVTFELPLRECNTTFGRERVWSPQPLPGRTRFDMAQPVTSCASAGTVGNVFLVPAQWQPTAIGRHDFTFLRRTYLGPSLYTAAGPTTSFQLSLDVLGLAPRPVHQGMWWNAPAGSESGWGVYLAQQGDTIFASWFTFDFDGSPLWMVVAAPKTATNVYSGTLYKAVGPAFNAVPFAPSAVVETVAGTASFTFIDDDNATFAYTVYKQPPVGIGFPATNISRTRQITRQVFATPVPTCTWGPLPDHAQATNFTDLWWNAPASSESGWGISLAHQGDTIFAVWFTYGLDHKPVWLAVAATRTGPNVYSGDLYTATGPVLDATQFDAAKVVPTKAGTATFAFADGASAAFSYAVNGVSQTKSIARQVFSPPGTVCR